MNSIKDIFKIEKKPRKGLLAVEWVVLGYMLLTTLIILFTYTKAINPESMLWGRFRILVIIAALWAVYRLVPCRFTLFCRIGVHLALLSWWYPDTYEINRVLPNLDPIFATWEQQLFGCQPALLFYEAVPSVFFSELMLMGYASYYPMIGVVALYYFFRRYQDFERITFIILASFFIYYVIFVALPVTGPQYYYHAAGLDNIVKGVFPDIGNYFATHQDKLPIPGSPNGFFHQLMEAAHETGERPTAAFPSSHVGVTIILALLAWRTCSKGLITLTVVGLILMNFATVYLRAHYVIDIFAGWVSALTIYAVLNFLARKFV
ncbi:PAP2 superfamily protein [Prevotella sp. ne3005]|uniref:phosphatase PAP2 family protein n=1 Tax=Prevotella sp. ne3005 TaxID=1761887 RepID=UPI0008CB8029|nr:phosphatase PAP2 family protein [Prevotella sp. ne3005]SEM76296.1 PAP2 superfamily protein [Prevotella sp. ne3005]